MISPFMLELFLKRLKHIADFSVCDMNYIKQLIKAM